MDPLDKTGISLKKLLQDWRIPLDSHPAERMLQYLRLLEKWNSRVNLTASSDWDSIGFLFEEAIWASKFYGKSFARHLDIGSGAGFPAIVLKILNPSIALEMVESREKRAIFLETVLAELGLKDSKVSNSRILQIGPKAPAKEKATYLALHLVGLWHSVFDAPGPDKISFLG